MVRRRMRRSVVRPKLVSKKWTSGMRISRRVIASTFNATPYGQLAIDFSEIPSGARDHYLLPDLIFSKQFHARFPKQHGDCRVPSPRASDFQEHDSHSLTGSGFQLAATLHRPMRTTTARPNSPAETRRSPGHRAH